MKKTIYIKDILFSPIVVTKEVGKFVTDIFVTERNENKNLNSIGKKRNKIGEENSKVTDS